MSASLVSTPFNVAAYSAQRPQPRTLVAVGLTGDGKSLLLSTLAQQPNLFPSAAAVHSVTSGASGHVVHAAGAPAPEDAMLLVDTPGPGDSRGAAQEAANMQSVLDYVRPLTHVAVFAIVISAHRVRFDAAVQSMLEAYVRALGPGVWQNVVIVVTHHGMGAGYAKGVAPGVGFARKLWLVVGWLRVGGW